MPFTHPFCRKLFPYGLQLHWHSCLDVLSRLKMPTWSQKGSDLVNKVDVGALLVFMSLSFQ